MLDAKEIIIGSRSSNLAIKQAEEVKQNIILFHPEYRLNPHLIKIETFKTTGDKIIDRSLVEIGGKGLFIKEIEEALLSKKIDIAVHSLKDIPGFFSDDTNIFAILERRDPRDAFISCKYSKLEDLPLDSTIGTSSPRRASLILNQRPDLKIVNFRGNVETRLEKLRNGQVDATILAVAGLERSKMQNHITSIIETTNMLPAVGQGALALQGRNDNKFIIGILKSINHHESYICTEAEREFLKTIDGSCNTPLAAHCIIKDNQLHLKALLASLDGKEIYNTTKIGKLNEGKKIGSEAGIEIKNQSQHILDTLNV